MILVDVFDDVLHVVRSALVCKNGEYENFKFSRFLTLNQVINALEESDKKFSQNFYDISIVPIQGANNYVTDEDSREEDGVNFKNLPPLLLNAFQKFLLY